LEVIFTHLADSDEKALVREELSRRYYHHYLSLIDTPAGASQAGPPSGTGSGAAGERLPATGAPSLEDLALEDLAGIGDVTLPRLTAPSPPETAAGPTAEVPPEKSAKKKYCFIATAAYGTPLAPEVIVLQHFRDDYLAPSALGEACLRAYYRCSPRLAGQISRHPVLGRLARIFLTPIIRGIKKACGYAVRA
jgi:hypothetical protein